MKEGSVFSLFCQFESVGFSNDVLDLSCPVNDLLTFFESDLLAEYAALYVISIVNYIGACGAENFLDLFFAFGIGFAVDEKSYVLSTVGIKFAAETSYFIGGFAVEGYTDQYESFLVSGICRGNVVCETAACLTDSFCISDELTLLGRVHYSHFHNIKCLQIIKIKYNYLIIS